MFWAVRQEVKNCLSIHRSDSFVAPSSCKLVVKCLMEIQAGSNFCHRQWDCWRSNLHTRWSKTLVGCNLLGQGLKNTCLRSCRWRKVGWFVLLYFHRHELFHGVQARRSRAKRSNTGCDHFDSLYFTLLRRSLATVVRAFCPPLFRCSLSFYCLFPELFLPFGLLTTSFTSRAFFRHLVQIPTTLSNVDMVRCQGCARCTHRKTYGVGLSKALNHLMHETSLNQR